LLYANTLEPELARMRHAAAGMYEDERASINLCLDAKAITQASSTAKRFKGCQLLIIVGIGGSDLGTIAIQEAILGRQHNLVSKPTVLYADTVDPHAMWTTNAILTQHLRSKKRVVVNIISKSGKTTETIANAQVLLTTLEHYQKKRWKESVVITADEGSPLWDMAAEQNILALSIPKKVGGRYSVLSAVGLFPLAVMGVNIKKLMDGAAHMRAACLKEDPKENPAMLRAAMLMHAWHRGKNVADQFFFSVDLEGVGKWYRQLMGESIGKEWNRDHTKRIHVGMTPTVSIGSTDLHSMAQLYFGGPNDKFYTIATVNEWKKDVRLPKNHPFAPLVPNIQGKQLSTIMGAIQQAVLSTLRSIERPHCVITLPSLKEESIGALLQMHMMEMMYLGALLQVNPFDQPNVET